MLYRDTVEQAHVLAYVDAYFMLTIVFRPSSCFCRGCAACAWTRPDLARRRRGASRASPSPPPTERAAPSRVRHWMT